MPGFQEFVIPYGANTNTQYSSAALPAYAQMFSGFPQSAANLYGSAGQAFTGYGQGLAGQSNAQSQNYGSYSNALGNLAQAYANQASNRYSANAMAEAARQGALGNIGSASLGAYGTMGGQALQAWAANQQAYNSALAQMTGANQNAHSQLGQSRNSALAGLGGAYASAASGLAPSTVAGDIAFNFSDMSGGGGYGGDGFSATGPEGSIGSGSYGGGGGGGGMTFSGSRKTTPGNIQGIVDQTYGGMGGVLSSLNNDRTSGELTRGYERGMSSLDSQHASSREMPSQMLNQGLQGLTQLGGMAYGNSSRGMDQFYGEMDRAYDPRMYSNIAGMLGSGYGDSSRRVSGNAASLNSAYGDTKQQYTDARGDLNNMWKGLMTPTPVTPPAKSAAQQRRDAEDEMLSNMFSDYYRSYYRSPQGATQPQQLARR